MNQRKRIAIYGGTFDPVHMGHLEIGRRISQVFEIDQFLFVPARQAPHKQDREPTSGFQRYAMLALATQNAPELCVSTFEMDAAGRQYTVDTLTHFCSHFGESAELFFVMGADSWTEITTWREWEKLTTLANLIVVTRPGFKIDVPESQPGTKQVFVSNAVMLDISATQVRQAVREGDEDKLNQLVPLEVANYIRKYGLYRNTNEA
ncbi:MAG TPA: nicotinate-nucleotide adenylyltransferase [Pyrinomonadaceae bacterium]|nr:nicotinate-nucleotide adenylyltransferase [Pyrinomonadaceae bacterium]